MALPERLGRLRRVERLGVGGFASVWRYFDEDLDSDVAVKALADNWAQRLDVRERFLEEARILRRADHDHVVRVHDLGRTDDGTPYFVMTYADRGTVADLMAQGPVAHALVGDLVDQAARGLGRLHDQGTIHRDVKPQNLLLRTDGDRLRLMVADLGLAKATLHASGLTQVVGTPAYMAPEQAAGEPLTPATDTHALAAVAYQLLTGQPARAGTLHDLATLAPEVRPPSTLPGADHLGGRVDDVLLPALAREPRERPADVRELGERLREALSASGQPDAASAPPRGPMPSRGSTGAGRGTSVLRRSGSALAVVLVLLVTFWVAFVLTRVAG